MKNSKRRSLTMGVAAILFTVLIGTGAAFGQGQETENMGGGRLAGTWDSQVRITDCATGNVITSFPSIANFNQGGTLVGSASGRPQALRTPEHGVWRHLGGKRYQFRFKTFTFNPAGQAIGFSVVDHLLDLNNRSDDYYYSWGIARHYAMDGTQVGNGCSDAFGTRMTL